MSLSAPATDAAGLHRHRVEATLVEVLGELDPALRDDLLPKLASFELAGGEVLMREGEPSDALYLVLSGRLVARSCACPSDPLKLFRSRADPPSPTAVSSTL